MNKAKIVADNIPPITVQPIVCLDTAPAPTDSAKGTTPKMKAKEVITIGRNLNLTASIVDGINPIPQSTLSFANSTIRIAFFAESPIKVIKPT
ncbi:hypothetical protein D3C87_1757270 [compost metagenome]